MTQATGVAGDPGYGEVDPLVGRARSGHAVVVVNRQREIPIRSFNMYYVWFERNYYFYIG